MIFEIKKARHKRSQTVWYSSYEMSRGQIYKDIEIWETKEGGVIDNEYEVSFLVDNFVVDNRKCWVHKCVTITQTIELCTLNE